MIPHDTINKLEETWTSISEFCAALTEQQWKTASQLPAWTVQDNLSHMVGTESGLEGNPRTEHKATDTSHIRNPIGEMNEHDVDSRRSMSGAAVLAEWNTLTATRLHTLKNADDAYFEKEYSRARLLGSRTRHAPRGQHARTPRWSVGRTHNRSPHSHRADRCGQTCRHT
jgi:uncharacterized protein (TIGR03083 family)